MNDKIELSGGKPLTEDYRDINVQTGQQRDYIVLAKEERDKGFVRPVRRSYIHLGIDPVLDGPIIVRYGKNGCGALTTMSQDIAETYARDPKFYSGTFCVGCRTHFPVEQFVWDTPDQNEKVGS